MNKELDTKTRTELAGEIAYWMGLDGQVAQRDEADSVKSIYLRRLSDDGKEASVTELFGNDLSGRHQTLEGIVSIIESAVLRDAATLLGTVLYTISFQLHDGRRNRGRYAFTAQGDRERLLRRSRAAAEAGLEKIERSTLSRSVGAQPVWPDGASAPRCSEEECNQYDGKRCAILGSRPGALCEPVIIELVKRTVNFKEPT